MILEFSQFLENYLWPNYNAANATFAHMMSIVIMLNEKFRERVAPWQVNNNLFWYFLVIATTDNFWVLRSGYCDY